MEPRHAFEKFAKIAFFWSGFSGLLYQVVWLRLAYASYGVITPVLSTVLSVFMLGLALGSYFGGKIAKQLGRNGIRALLLYGAAELTIAIGGLIVPFLLRIGLQILLHFEGATSGSYLVLSGILISLSLLPWCIAMGATIPFVTSALNSVGIAEKRFTLLYSWNVFGGTFGCAFSAFVGIELFGLTETAFIGVLANLLVAAGAFLLARTYSTNEAATQERRYESIATTSPTKKRKSLWMILFLNGLVSMAMEVVWTRAFTHRLGTTIYAFAGVLGVYLIATWFGSVRFRGVEGRSVGVFELIFCSILASFLPLLLSDPRLELSYLLVIASIFPYCAILGYLTPMLVDEISEGDPETMGRAYACNILGCIVGPLIAGYLFLPLLGVKFSLLALIAVLFLSLIRFLVKDIYRFSMRSALGICVFIALVFFSLRASTFEDPELFGDAGGGHVRVERDFVATVVAYGQGFDRQILVNGVGITLLTPITKFVAHLPLAFHTQNPSPQRALVICLGMGTTFRSAASWGIDTTVVELVPGVAKVLDFFFPDLPSKVDGKKRRIIIDDGRRFLRRTDEQFDVITLDPPPPIEAAGVSLLYGREFYQIAKRRLAPHGLVQQWVPSGEKLAIQAIARAMAEEFPFLKVFHSVESWGYHFIGSMEPFEEVDADRFLNAMPKGAIDDMMEWYPNKTEKEVVQGLLAGELPISDLLNSSPEVVITDDRPYNEYFILRREKLGLETLR